MPGPGTKVSDPHNEIHEGTGAVASDALAADSDRARGGFSENPNSEPLGVSGSNSTFANSNTSGAKKLSPATDAESRDSEPSYPRAQPDSKDEGFSQSKHVGSAGVAPGYINAQYVDGGKPKGKNLTEGGFEGYDGKNASFNQEIGGKNDPGRLAEAKFVRDNAAGGIATFPTQKGDAGDNTYEALDRESSA